MEQVIKILEEIKPGIDYSRETDLIGDKTPIDIVPENFKSAEAIYAMVKRLEEE